MTVYLNMKKWFLIVIYSVGLIGLIVNPDMFIPLSIWSLLFTFGWIIGEAFSWKKMALQALVILLGWGIEWIGVHTKMPFGIYEYGSGLGQKWQDVPLIIGVNWLVISWSSLQLVRWAWPKSSRIQMSILGGLMMTMMDVLMESVAPKLDYWMFQMNMPPLNNYIAWFWVGSFFCWILSWVSMSEKKESSAVTVWWVWWFFFMLLMIV